VSLVPTIDADWVSKSLAEARERRAAMERHPAGMAWHRRQDPGPFAIPAAPPLPAFEEEVYELASELAAVLISKQADYGPKAINDAPGGPVMGVLVRAHDKLARLENLVDVADPEHEAYRDSWLDLAGYAFIGLLLADGAWPQ
jgi:hypothetical protein